MRETDPTVPDVVVAVQEETIEDCCGEDTQAAVPFDLHDRLHALVPERVTLKFSVKMSGLSVKLFISQCNYFATLNII